MLVGFAWQYPFYLYVIAVPIAGVVWLGFEEPGDTAPSGAPPDTATDGGTERARGVYLRRLARLVVEPKVAAVLVAYGVAAFLYIAFLTYNSFLVVGVLGATPDVAGAFITVVSVVYAATASQAGRVTSYFGSRAAPLVVANLLMGGGLATAAFAPSVMIAGAASAVMGVGIGLAFSLLRSVLTRLAPEQFRGGLIGVGEAVIRLANSLAPITVGAVVTLFAASGSTVLAIRQGLLVVGVGAAVLGSAAMGLASVARAVATP
jgi:MFS family permease